MDDLSREHIDIYTIKFLYRRYKSFVIPFLVIIVVILLFVRLTVPAIQDLFEGYEKQKESRLVIDNIRQNLNFIKTIDDSSLESQFKVVTKALPPEKDFDSVLNAISDSSNKSGVVLSGFKFTVGNLSKEEIESEYPSLNLELTLDGDAETANIFIGSLAKTLPLSEIAKVSAQKDSSIVTIEFFYKPVKASINNDSLPIIPISNKGLELIDNMSALNIPQASDIDLPVSTPSANPFF
ncbi:MAG: hypothetical protein A3D74_04895 [Candidatus Levybacteria bacterium RIFCSPHIGHO2_02_FULL_37_13]|nr:MAG: hypothetical protein A3D74_04895 [Candidatus Levybacteria bacterium RIFCSPHIGHO2_02_FULL_37_13]OGH40370.1 MAG: hypothetical protein A3B41_01880 [Candidatus Levybacteria bacterium RIFCSPLOWO2_01_FULL_37_26]